MIALPSARRHAARVLSLCATAALAALAPAVACAPRQVNVTSGPEPVVSTLAFTNHLATAVNVYVRDPGGTEVFVRQVAAGGNEALAIRNVAPGVTVSLRAAPVDGGRAYTRDNVTLGAGASWTIP